MPTPTKGARLGGSPAHEQLILANLATSLFEHGRITTTAAKAKRLRPLAERLITKAKRGDLHNRREVLKVVRDKDVLHKLFAEIGPFFASRNGGYTRITKTLPRKGDNAPMAVIELISEKTVTAEAEAARKTKFAKGTPAKPKTAKAKPAKATEAEPTEAEPTEAKSAEAESAAETDAAVDTTAAETPGPEDSSSEASTEDGSEKSASKGES